MKTNRSWIAYDWFRPGIALIFLVLLAVGLASCKPTSSDPSDLPASPPALFSWTYDASSRSLLDPSGIPFFTLSTDGTQWQPIIPAGMEATLPSGYQLVLDESGGWVIIDEGGSPLYRWGMQTFRWIEEPLTTADAAQPASASVSTLDPLPQSAGRAIPPPPTPSPTSIPSESTPTPDTSTQDATRTASAAGRCKAPLPPRLEIGKNARVLYSLNMRSEHEIGDNIIATQGTGTRLKVVQGPVCEPYEDSAYLWWRLEDASGRTGWVVENFLNGDGYYLLPLPYRTPTPG